MPKRKAMNRQASKKLFTRTASKVNSKNLRGAPMRGGIRL